MSFGCGFINEDIRLSEPLQQLKDEHAPLRAAMEHFNARAKGIMTTKAATYNEAFQEFHEKVASFTAQLMLHSAKEDDGLFPMMVKYMGREAGPIAVMEYEHEQAKLYLEQFLACADRMKAGEHEDVNTVAGYAAQAYSILSDHFDKEEGVLFPIAEQILSSEEKAQLKQFINK